jgi:hypothetical protein
MIALIALIGFTIENQQVGMHVMKMPRVKVQ